ncbi:hypothetical protein [Ferruginibacter sp. HRS2-29]|uniref:hypothetical protein n=1 Tax=Ferruginibacter sp. HRS2-29 TaxID=2487334 RepID=UPI0020CEFBC5|nr:hypothetical protein [Ferruginibacter sp. HRS2-29]MCP9751108.1 hypothetical protein [Ferruginibacter sp. HRS2-29]
MKIRHFLFAAALLTASVAAKAQSTIPEGYTKAEITLADGKVLNGYIKDNIRKSSSVVFLDDAGQNKKTYEGSAINGLKAGNDTYTCISGDFFKVVSNGKLVLLQKSSNSSGKVSYNGADAVVSTGTAGKVGDYYIYADNKLKVLNKKTSEAFIHEELTGCAAAIEKANSANGDMLIIKEAVDIYNEFAQSKAVK